MQRQKLKRVLIMAGGTGGHVFPGLAVANYLREKGVEVHWLGTQQGIEARVVPEARIPLHFITIGGLRGKGIKPILMAPIKLSAAIWQAKKIMQKINPDVVIGMGGFASGPGGIASWLLRCPLVIHEQNAKAGFTNKALALFARKILEGFNGTFKPQVKVIATGNPVRPEIENILSPAARLHPPRTPFRLLVLGGSLGAQVLNEIVPRALAILNVKDRPEVWHQTGEKHFEATKKHYETIGIQANLAPFVKDMAEVYNWADLVLCRAGALTVAELCAVGLGAILIPFPHAVDDHQTANANFMVKNHAALCIQQAELTPAKLADIVREFAQSPEKRLQMAEAAYQLRKINVPKEIFAILNEIVTMPPS